MGFQHDGSRTVLGQCTHQGPLQVQRPFYPEGPEVCHVAILHPPGGVVGGDELRLDARIETGAHALLTTLSGWQILPQCGFSGRSGAAFDGESRWRNPRMAAPGEYPLQRHPDPHFDPD
ncbi:MAG: urease accessory protein UreD [Gammaproteobacteria bacterium]|nr:urease accessory protein UreD [Gammaproteobacteria bacterium]